MKRRVLHKLLGGPMHGKRYRLPPSTPGGYTFAGVPTMTCYFERDPSPQTLPPPKELFYTRHQAKIGNNLVDFYAISTKTGKEAFEMLCNHLLRDTEILSEDRSH